MKQTHIISQLAKSKHAFTLLELFYNLKEVDSLDIFLLNKDEAVKTLEEQGLIETSKNKTKITELGIETFAYMILR